VAISCKGQPPHSVLFVGGCSRRWRWTRWSTPTGIPALPLPHVFKPCPPQLALYTILLFPILYGVWHTHRRSHGGRILPFSRAIVLQQGGQCRWAGGVKARLIRAQVTPSKKISCKGQPPTHTVLFCRRMFEKMTVDEMKAQLRAQGDQHIVGNRKELVHINIYRYIVICASMNI